MTASKPPSPAKNPILIYGDYDVDGTTAIVILKTAIELCGGVTEFHVPHRIRDGYDMRDDVIERAAASGIRLIISVDMGIRAFAPAETARRLGVDLIVTDHHLPGPQGVPPALAVINPNQAGCVYPCKAFCGAGVAFKVAQALIERRMPENDHARLLTLVHESRRHRDYRRCRSPHRRKSRLRQAGTGRTALGGQSGA